MGNHWKASHGVVYAGPLPRDYRRDVDAMKLDEELKEIEITLNVRIWLSDKDMDSATYQELFDLLKELNSN